MTYHSQPPGVITSEDYFGIYGLAHSSNSCWGYLLEIGPDDAPITSRYELAKAVASQVKAKYRLYAVRVIRNRREATLPFIRPPEKRTPDWAAYEHRGALASYVAVALCDEHPEMRPLVREIQLITRAAILSWDRQTEHSRSQFMLSLTKIMEDFSHANPDTPAGHSGESPALAGDAPKPDSQAVQGPSDHSEPHPERPSVA